MRTVGYITDRAFRTTPISHDEPVRDSRSRFREIFSAVQSDHGLAFPYNRPCSRALHRLPNEPAPSGKPVHLGPARQELRIVVVAGIFGECVESMASPFEDAIVPLQQSGWSFETLRVSGRSGSAANACQIRDQLLRLKLAPEERLVLIGYSKGMSDILELIGSPDGAVIPAGSSIVSIAGVVRGTLIADRLRGVYRTLSWIPFPGCSPGDGQGVESLTRAHRLNWLLTHPLPTRLHYYSIPAFTGLDNVSVALRSGWKTLSESDARNDGNVIASDSLIPGSELLGYANSDHWALVLPFALKAPIRANLFATKNEYPRVVLIESIARFLEEKYLEGASIRS